MQTIHSEERAKINRIDRLYETKAKPPSRSLHTKHDFVNGHDAHTHTHVFVYIYESAPPQNSAARPWRIRSRISARLLNVFLRLRPHDER